MKRYREYRTLTQGFAAGTREERVVELANDAKPAEGAEQVGDGEELHDWQPVEEA